MVFKALAEQGEEFFKQKWRGDDGWPSVVLEAVALKNLGAPAKDWRSGR